MKRILILSFSLLLLQISACKKDDALDANSNQEKVYTVTKYVNNQISVVYEFTESKLVGYKSFLKDGSRLDTVIFHYNKTRLDSLTIFNFPTGSTRVVTYQYNSDNKVFKMVFMDDPRYFREYTIYYNNLGNLREITWIQNDIPFFGNFEINNLGNVIKYKYNYPNSQSSDNREANWVAFDQYPNVLNRFWMVDPSMELLSLNKPVEIIRNTATYYNFGGGNGTGPTFANNKFDITYTYNSNDYVLKKQISDSTGVVEVVEFEYSGF